MKLCLLLCLSFVPWSHSRSYPASRDAQKPQPQTQPIPQPQSQLQPQTQPKPQDPPHLNCDNLESLRAAHDRERLKIPRGEKFDDFDWHLSKELNTVERGNIVISPISLKVVLAMLYEGARGTTAKEIGDALDIHNNTLEQRRHSRERFSTILQSLQTSDDGYKIKMGTHAFIDQTAEVRKSYQCKLKAYYNSDIVKVDYSNPSAAVKVINNWAKNVTEGHIQDLISESETQSSTIMLLLNAVYFKGQWEVPFPANQTKEGIFHLDNQKTVKVPFMNVTESFGYYNLPEIGAHMVQLPYKGNKFSMFVLLPYNNTSLDSIAKTLGPEKSLSGIINRMMPTNINLIMPKFEFDFTTKLRSTLEKLGIKTMFSADAELMDIAETQGNGLVVSNVLQKAGISVTEAGTVAYAATAVELVNKFGGSEETVDFVVNRPFLFFIEDTNLKTTVFVGKVTNPDKVKVTSTPQATTENTTGASGSDALDRLGPNGQSGDTGPLSQPESQGQSSQAMFNYFDGDLLLAVGQQVPDNFVISPASVKTLLGLMLEAADGATLVEIKKRLRLPNNPVQARQLMGSLQVVLQKMNTSKLVVDSETNLFIANDLTFNTSYVKVISEVYKAGVGNVDFKSPENAANTINGWVSAQTRGKIQSIIDPGSINPETLTVLVNTVYFDGKWKKPFMLKDTKEECFYPASNRPCSTVPIMFKKDMLNHRFHQNLDCHVVQVPFEDERFSMVLVVPSTVDGAKNIGLDINKLTFPMLLDGVKSKQVHLKLPRFSVEYSSDIKQILTRMGLNDVFSEEANLPFMINNKQGRVSAIIHKAKIEVNEKGAKAVAASAGVVVPLMSGNEDVLVTADHPFYYFIYEVESKSVLFSGHISSLPGETGSEENLLNEGAATPLSGNDFQKPSYAHVATGGYAGSSRPHNYPNREYSSPSKPASNGVSYAEGVNHPYNVDDTTNLPQFHSTTAHNQDSIDFPADQVGESLSSKYLEQYKKQHSGNHRSQQRSSLHH